MFNFKLSCFVKEAYIDLIHELYLVYEVYQILYDLYVVWALESL